MKHKEEFTLPCVVCFLWFLWFFYLFACAFRNSIANFSAQTSR
jgi:hypothetical protein